MIFIFGTKPVLLNEITPKSIKCNFCESQGTVTLISRSSHTHLYYIPMFPLGVKISAYCHDCTYEANQNEFPQNYYSHIDLLKNDSKTPFWQFTGIAIISIAITLGIVRSRYVENRDAAYITTPAIGDVYHYKTGYSQYSTMKVISINYDSIFYIHNDMEADRYNMLSELNVEENYGDDIYYILNSELDSMQNANALIDIIRELD